MRRRWRLEFERLEDRLEMAGPTVSSISPNTGPPAGGTDVTIGGTNFTNVQAVFFGANQATNVSVVSPTTIDVTSPAGTGVVDVTVQTAAGTSPTNPADQFTYQASTLPTVTGLNPDNGPVAGGTSVTITGTNFTGATAVDFGTTAATNVTVVDSTTITATSPAAGGPGPVDVTVTTGAGTSPINRPADVFTYTTATSPTVTGINPNSGPVAGGTSVTITGTNFTGATVVDFGTTAVASFTVVSSTQITTTSPAAAGPGPVDVTVTTPSGTSPITPNDVFTYVAAAPSVTNINPNSGPVAGGTSVTITGTGFTGATAVDFGTIAVTSFTVVNSTTISAASPAAAGPGPVDVTVTTPAGTSPINRPGDVFTYIAAPAVTGVTPNSGPVAGGTSVTITGTNFTGATAVDFGTTAVASFTVVSDTQITTSSPAAAGPGPVDVTVTTPSGTSATTSSDVFTYLAAAPSVLGLQPNQGPTIGGTLITITGTGFSGATAVNFGTTAAASFAVTSSTTITAVSPPGTGAVDVTVTTPQGTSAASPADVFTYIASTPTVTGISPKTGPTGGGTTVTITGTGFLSPTGAVTVLFGANMATDVRVISANTITAVSPPGTGAVDVVVKVDGVGSATSPADVFTYATSVDGPRVIRVVRYGYHRQSTFFVISFDMPLDPSSARLASNYSVIQSGVVWVTGKPVRVKAAAYNPASHAVTLSFARRLPLRQIFLLTINGTTPSGVKNLDGLLLDGAGTGRPGSDYVTTVSQDNLAGPASQRPVASVRRAGAMSLRDRVAQFLLPRNASRPGRPGRDPSGSAT